VVPQVLRPPVEQGSFWFGGSAALAVETSAKVRTAGPGC